jgi:hypothetical protein
VRRADVANFVPIVLKSGSLNLLEPSGPVKACNEIVLPYCEGWRKILSVMTVSDR